MLIRQLLLILFVLSLVFSATGCESPPTITRLSADSVVLAFGDSLTHGNGAPQGQAYPDVLGALLGVTVVNAGVPGEISANGLQRLPIVLDKYRPSVVILCHGGNDFLRRHSRSETEKNLRAMIELIRAKGADVVLVGVPEPGLILEPPDFYGQLAKQYAIPYEPEIVSDLLGDRSLKSDTIHPNAAGYRLLAESLASLIEKSQS